MAFDIPIDLDYFDHPKTKRLCILLKKPEGDIYPLRLWRWCARYAKEGQLPADVPLIEAELGWKGAPGRLHGCLMGTGFIEPDGVTVHDWMDHIGRAIMLYDAKKRKMRAKYDVEKGILPETFRKNSGSLPPTQDTQDTQEAKPYPGGDTARPNSAPPPTQVDDLPIGAHKPNGASARRNCTNASDEIFRQMWALAKRVCIIGKDETLGSYLRGWIAQKGGAEVERILSEPRCKGRAILDVQKWYFDGMVMKGD